MFTGYITKFLLPFSQGNNSSKISYPDWTKPEKLKYDTKYVINKNGWIHWEMIDGYNSLRTLYINNIPLSHIATDNSNEYLSDEAILVPIQKGDEVISIGGGVVSHPNLSYFVFYPNK